MSRAVPSPGRRLLLTALACPLAAALPARALEEVPYVKTPDAVVEAILALAGVGPADTLYDLGSGDGRIVIAAALRHGTRGVGVEIDPALVRLSNERARAAGVAERARFVQQDLFETDFSAATVVTMYLLPDVNLALRPRLLATLRPGTRVVSHDWDLGDWRPDRTVVVPVPDKPVGLEKSSRVMLWVVPAGVDGIWRGRVIALPHGSAPLEVSITQRYQQLSVQVAFDGRPASGEGRVDGTLVSFTAGTGADAMRFGGELRDGHIEGSAAIGAWRGRFSLAR
jgi:hypothetical protein